MDTSFLAIQRRQVWSGCGIWIVTLLSVGSLTTGAAGADVNFDFARLAECRDVTPAERAERYPLERLIAVRVPVSVRFSGLARGEVEHLDIEIDGSPAGLRVNSFLPATQLSAEAKSIETIQTKKKGHSIGASLGGGIPVPVGPIVAEVGPSLSTGTSKSEESTEKIKRLPPKQPVVVSGTFAHGQGVFFKFKRSSQTSFEGVHELEVTFVAPVEWRGGGLRIACTARGHRPMLWMDQPTVFGRVVDTIQLYPEGDAELRDAAARRAEEAARAGGRRGDWGLGAWVLGG